MKGKQRKSFSAGGVNTMGGLHAGTFSKGKHGTIDNNASAPKYRAPRRKRHGSTEPSQWVSGTQLGYN